MKPGAQSTIDERTLARELGILFLPTAAGRAREFRNW